MKKFVYYFKTPDERLWYRTIEGFNLSDDANMAFYNWSNYWNVEIIHETHAYRMEHFNEFNFDHQYKKKAA